MKGRCKVKKNDVTSSYLKDAGVIRLVDLKVLRVDESYQREEKPHAEKIAQDFDPAACDPLLVAERSDGSLWDVDGRQRRKALLSLGITQWMCKVVKSSGPEYEARLFSIKGGARGTVKQLQPREVFKSELVANDPVAVAVKRAVIAAGLKLGLSNAQNGYPYLVAFKMLQRNVKKCGEQKVIDALRLVRKCWPDQNNAVQSAVVDGLIAIVYRPETDIVRLEQVLTNTPVNSIYQEAHAGDVANGTGSRRAKAFAAIAKRYNKCMKRTDKRRIPVRVRVYGDDTAA